MYGAGVKQYSRNHHSFRLRSLYKQRSNKIPSVIPSGYFFLFNDGEL